MNSRATPVALPSSPLTPAVPDGKPAERPVAGPVVPLTVTPSNSEELLGGAGNSSPHGDAIATRVLVKGEPVSAPPVAAAPAEALASAPADTVPTEPAIPPDKKTATPKSGTTGKTTQNSTAKPKPPPKQNDVPRPPRGIFPSGGSPFSFFR
jgi:hypothetical protein